MSINAIKVFLSGDKKKRVQAIKEKHGCTEREAARLVDKTDEKRSAYHNYYTGQGGDRQAIMTCVWMRPHLVWTVL
ncbi:MAG: cytidylate kinase family protein [Roseburia sp.]